MFPALELSWNSAHGSMLKALKQDAAFFDGFEPRLIYIARRLKEALALEDLLTAAGFDYGVEADRYRGGFIFQSERIGAFFYVRPDAETAVREFLADRGYRLPSVDTIRRIEESSQER